MSPFALLLALLPTPPGVAVERQGYVMGTRLAMRVEGRDRGAALAASEAALEALEAAERRLSTWGGDGELARLLATPVGSPVRLSPELAEELRAAAVCRVLTGGGFDPAVGPLVAVWGVREGGRRPSDGELEAARDASRWDDLELDGSVATRRRASLVLDEGGFGKGAGLDRAVAALRKAGAGPAWIDLGGQVATTGRFVAAVADPDERGKAVVAVSLGGGSLATTGDGERGLLVDGERRSHVLDPRSGEPAASFGSVSVWAPRAFEADCLSTGLYALGRDGALAWAERHPAVGVLVLAREGGRLHATATGALRGRVRPLDEDLAGLDSTFDRPRKLER